MAKTKKSAESVPQVSTEQPPEVPQNTISYYEAVGRRKEASARVRLYVIGEELTIQGQKFEKGTVMVNNMAAEKYFPGEVRKKVYLEPFRTTNTLGRFGVSIRVEGGGLSGQMAASVLGISRALEKVDKEKFRPILKKRSFLSRDSRIRQRRRAGFAGKSRARKQSPKR